MGMMNNITKTLKETFKPKQRRAAIGGILGPIMIVVIVIAGVGVLAAMFFDLADTASIVDSIELSNQAVYSDQGFVTVQVKNGGNTGIETIYAVLLVADADLGADCDVGIEEALISGITAHDLDPGESVTISGSLWGKNTATGVATPAGTIYTAVQLTACVNSMEDRAEYILQIKGDSDGEAISKTITVRAQ